MRDLYLRFKDAAEMRLTLLAFGFTEEYDHLLHDAISLDIIGGIPVPEIEIVDGLFDDSKSPDYIPGYHVNIRISDEDMDTTILDPFAISPKTPSRVWA